MTLKELKQMAEERINSTFTIRRRGQEHQVNPGEKGWKFKWVHTKRALGQCRWNKRRGIKLVCLSKTYWKNNLKEENKEHVLDTILHEIAHAINVELFNGRGHCKDWELICRQIGATPNRLSDKPLKRPKSKWTIKCECGVEKHFYRKPRPRSCGRCGPSDRYSEDHRMELIQNY